MILTRLPRTGYTESTIIIFNVYKNNEHIYFIIFFTVYQCLVGWYTAIRGARGTNL